MNAVASHPQSPDDARLWTPSRVDAIGAGLPRQDPVAQLLAEQQRDGSLLRLVMCATAATLILVLSAGLLI